MDKTSKTLQSAFAADALMHLLYSFITRHDVQLTLVILTVGYIIFIRKSSADLLRKDKYTYRPHVPVDKPYLGEESRPLKLKSVPVTGWLPTILARWTKDTYFRNKMLHTLKGKFKYDLFRRLILPEEPTFNLLVDDGLRSCEKDLKSQNLFSLIKEEQRNSRFNFVSISDLHLLYREGKKTPEEVMKTLVHCLKEADNQRLPLKAVIEYNEDGIMEQAVSSTKRWQEGNILSLFDGIPVAIKDQFIVGDHHARRGLPFEVQREEVSSEKGLVKKLRKGGAIIIGMTNMDQIGSGIFGINPSKYHGSCRNPYNPLYSSGGSSSGSASVVASGLSIVALGTDGGGSIRIPAAHCGVVGLKATYGAYSTAGIKGCSTTLSHTGALCSTVRDTAISFAFLAGTDEPSTSILPHLGDFDSGNLHGLRVGVDEEWMERAPDELRRSCHNTLQWMKSNLGVEVVDIHIPEKLEMERAQVIMFCSEVFSNSRLLLDAHHFEINATTQGLLEMAQLMSADDYLQAAKQRTRSINALKYIFTQIDVILTPGFASFQPEILPSMDQYGYGNLKSASETVSLHQIGNLTGVPAITLPIGYTEENFPMAVQLIASWWREDILLKVGYAIEKCVEKKSPEIFFDMQQ